MIVTSIQLAMTDQPKEKNVEHALSLIDQAPPSDLILLPEIWPCGFFSFDRYERDSESIEGPIVKAFKDKARKINCYIFMGSMVENDGEQLFNTSIFLNPKGDIVAHYRKMHLFGYQSEEASILTPGRDVVVANTPWGVTGFSNCYDLRFPELFRRMVDQGAKFFLVTSAWPQVRLEAWKLFNRSRAHENLAFLVSCNCAGANHGKKYAGHSMIVDPLGQVVAEGSDEEEFVSARIDPKLVDTVRQDFPALEDRLLS
ncbi:MAG: carbon-nitrogen family hydrolase [Desulfobacterales bacterium]|jgi:predicted amidohydrolase|nr:carbon-nitrogen family hydrolase [Desulfobacterales bacterium]